MYSNIRLRAGLVALLFALITISLVSAVPIPIPASQSGLSSLSSRSTPSHNGQNKLGSDNRIIAKSPLDDHMSRANLHNSINIDDDQLVRRGIGSKIKKAFQKVGHAFKSAGSAIKHVAQKAGSAIKQVAQKAAAGVKKVAQKVGSGVRTAAQKVGHFVKTTGAKVAKFGLKVYQSVGTAVSKVASFIPDVGKPLERVIKGVSDAAGAISNRIHVKLPAKLQKGMNVMNKANKVMGYIPRRRDLSEQEDFLERDFSDAYYFEERDDISMEHEEGSHFDDDYEHYLDLE